MSPTKAPKANKLSPKKKRGPKPATVTRRSNELRIRFSNSHQLQDKLNTELHSIGLLHSFKLLTQSRRAAGVAPRVAPAEIGDGPTTQTAIDLVVECAGDSDLSATLGNIPALDPVVFQSCVQSAATKAGFSPTRIPASSSTSLSQVVQAVVGS
jgi:hypothetical protein